MIFLWIVVAVLSVLMVICVLALVDQYQTLELIRVKLKLEDTPEPLPLPQDRSLLPSDVGLPPALDTRQHLVVLFLSTSCNTCRSIAEGLKGRNTPDLWVVLEQAHSAEEGAQWLEIAGLPAERATVDVEGRVSATLGVDVTPSVVLYREGEPLLAQTIPSFRQLTPLLSARTLPAPLKEQPLKELKFAPEGIIQP